MACAATGGVLTAPGTTVTASTTATGAAATMHFRDIPMVTGPNDLFTYPTPTTTSHTSHSTHTTHNTTSTYKTTSVPINSTTSCTTTSAPTGTAPSSVSPAASSSSTTIPNAGLLSSSANLGGVFGAVAAVGALFFAGLL